MRLASVAPCLEELARQELFPPNRAESRDSRLRSVTWEENAFEVRGSGELHVVRPRGSLRSSPGTRRWTVAWNDRAGIRRCRSDKTALCIQWSEWRGHVTAPTG